MLCLFFLFPLQIVTHDLLKTMNSDTDNENKKVERYKYLHTSPRDLLWGLAVTTAGFQHVKPGDSYPLSSHPVSYNFSYNGHRVLNEYQLVYITRGAGYFESASCSKTRIEAGTMFMLFPSEWHTYTPDPDTGWNEHWIGFNGGFIEDKITNGFITFKNCVFKVGIDERIIGAFHEILDLVTDEKKGFQQIAAGLVISILGRIYYEDINHSFAESYISRIINQAKTIIKEDIAGSRSLEEIASSLKIGYSLFRREFKEKCGISPGQYRQEVKLAKAKELLYSTNLSIAEIAQKLHFENTGQFSTFFRKRTGTTPLEFRKKDASFE